MTETVKLVDLSTVKKSDYKNQFVGCLILTKNNQIMLQQRESHFVTYPNYLCEFGGHIEANETAIQAIIRELKEELGASPKEEEIISLGAITEAMSKHSELIYAYFWHDKHGTISGCYEGRAKYFDNVQSILENKNITDGLRWMLEECKKRHFIYML